MSSVAIETACIDKGMWVRMVRGSLHSNRTPRGGDAIKKINNEFKTLNETSSAEVAQNKQPITSYKYAEKKLLRFR